MAKLTQDEIMTAIESMTVLELSELIKALEEKFGVTASAPMMAMAPQGATAAADVEEKTSFNIILTGAGAQKLAVIKALRTMTELGLKEAKDVVEASDKEEKVIKENVSKDEADKYKKLLEEAGAKVKLQ